MSESNEQHSRVEPSVLQTALLDEIAERLLKLQQYEEEERAEGVTEPIEPVAVTDARRRVEAHVKPWFSVSLANDGPDDVWAIVNTEKSFDAHRVRVGETYAVSMLRGVIKDVLLWCDAGETGSVRLVGSR